ncbi:MAG: hypothetical protein BJ554DRAFT_1297 [Olpidium bornovanus]|uniref:Uncharacterized protein n=1 Tax=Olpidium bornovanus TaxID=278681 RepID=A0A8H8DH79_9FUNG|nr:MAG: hypothetical protein BJ554DRAFT_1297 [Olpidium bornovanus]
MSSIPIGTVARRRSFSRFDVTPRFSRGCFVRCSGRPPLCFQQSSPPLCASAHQQGRSGRSCRQRSSEEPVADSRHRPSTDLNHI